MAPDGLRWVLGINLLLQLVYLPTGIVLATRARPLVKGFGWGVLAIRLDDLLETGQLKDQAEIPRRKTPSNRNRNLLVQTTRRMETLGRIESYLATPVAGLTKSRHCLLKFQAVKHDPSSRRLFGRDTRFGGHPFFALVLTMSKRSGFPNRQSGSW